MLSVVGLSTLRARSNRGLFMTNAMSILTINGGSSSIKFALFQVESSLRRVLEGRIERIGLPEAMFVVKGSDLADNFSRPVAASDHTVAVRALMDWVEER